MASKSGSSGHKGKVMEAGEKARLRPINEARTARNKKQRAETRERRIQKLRDKLRAGLTVKAWRELQKVSNS
jgi:hypothetical protein